MFQYRKNKKIKNASPCECYGIKFKSKLELYCYKYFRENGIRLKYEQNKVVLMEGFSPVCNLYIPNSNRDIELSTKKIVHITYDCDFYLEYNDKKIYIESKGLPTDSYKIKKKLFLKQINVVNSYFFEPHNQEQIRQCYQIIKKIINN